MGSTDPSKERSAGREQAERRQLRFGSTVGCQGKQWRAERRVGRGDLRCTGQ